ncbi:MAG: hypothetical protein WBP45_06940 [Daejeonella sp.]
MKNNQLIYLLVSVSFLLNACQSYEASNAKEERLKLENKEIVDNILNNKFPDGSIKDVIPLIVTQNTQSQNKNFSSTASSVPNSVTVKLRKLGFVQLDDAKVLAITNWRESSRKLESGVSNGKIDDSGFEYQATIILRDLKLLRDTSIEARIKIKSYLDKFISIKSKNVILEYYALKAIEKDLSKTEIKDRAKAILDLMQNDTDYKNAVWMIQTIRQKLKDNPELYSIAATQIGFKLFVNALNSKIDRHVIYKRKIEEIYRASR